ncbi:MAG TPA: hypothetical protein VKN36_09085 [Eudoraea sp.]|nr:hypothetical protein [Eudoraea sp.]
MAGQKDIHVDLCYDDAVMEFPYNGEKIKLILNNLLANAIKSTLTGESANQFINRF